METTTKAGLAERLAEFEAFKGVDLEAIQWLIDRSEYVCYQPGEFLFTPGQAVDHMQVIVEGSYVIEMEQMGELRELGVWGAGYITGTLPFSRMTDSKSYGRALEPCCVLELHKRYFIEMVAASYELTQALVAVMTNRVRDFTSIRFQSEKLMALGKLSAGLAHELNNPAAAMVRDAEELYKRQHQTPERFKAVITMRISEEQTDQVNAILFERLKNVNKGSLSTLQRMEQADELLEWLEDHDIQRAEEIADTFVEFCVTTEDLDRIDQIVEGKHLSNILWWMENTLSVEKLVADIGASAGRINTIIQSVKQYSHMDRGVSMETIDIHEGLRSTLTMFQYPLRKKDIEVKADFDSALPRFPAYPSELNQVWTNLISNAIDAMDQGGTLTIRTYLERQYLCVDISDTGKGIPADNLTRIFDPFFTTKPIGEGTGMGLDIVKRIIDRHKGNIQVESEPGRTTFYVCFPLKQQA